MHPFQIQLKSQISTMSASGSIIVSMLLSEIPLDLFRAENDAERKRFVSQLAELGTLLQLFDQQPRLTFTLDNILAIMKRLVEHPFGIKKLDARGSDAY